MLQEFLIILQTWLFLQFRFFLRVFRQFLVQEFIRQFFILPQFRQQLFVQQELVQFILWWKQQEQRWFLRRRFQQERWRRLINQTIALSYSVRIGLKA